MPTSGLGPGGLPPSWATEAAAPQLAPDEVHVWRVDLGLPPERIRELAATLAPGEQARAERFRSPHDRERFIAGRGILRELLGQYLHQRPGDVRLTTTHFGKPILAPGLGSDGRNANGWLPVRCQSPMLHFNVSHTDGLALCAIARGRRVGIDVERVRPEFAALPFAERFFSAAEVRTLWALPELCRMDAFFRCWTCKEAYAKARGEGLSLDLRSFDVSFVPGEPIRLLATRPIGSEAVRWSLIPLDPSPGILATLAVEGPTPRVFCWQR